MNPRIYNDVIYKLNQATIGLITSSMCSISFEVRNETDVRVMIHSLIPNSIEDEMALQGMKEGMKKRLKHYTLEIASELISKEDFLNFNYQPIGYVIYLKNGEEL